MKAILLLLFSSFLISGGKSNVPQIKQITYEAGPCFGFCPIYKMTLLMDGSALIQAERFTFANPKSNDWTDKEAEGTYRATISEASMIDILEQINQLNLKEGKQKYGNRNIKDLPTAYLTIEYQNAASVQIEDYGKAGTPQLKALYQTLENLRQSETWQKMQ